MVEQIGHPRSKIKYKCFKDGKLYEKKERKLGGQNDANSKKNTDPYLEALKEISQLAEER